MTFLRAPIAKLAREERPVSVRDMNFIREVLERLVDEPEGGLLELTTLGPRCRVGSSIGVGLPNISSNDGAVLRSGNTAGLGSTRSSASTTS